MCSVVSAVSDSLQPYGLYSPPGFSCHGIIPTRILESLSFPPPGDLPNPGIKSASLAAPARDWKADSLPLETPGYMFMHN